MHALWMNSLAGPSADGDVSALRCHTFTVLSAEFWSRTPRQMIRGRPSWVYPKDDIRTLFCIADFHILWVWRCVAPWWRRRFPPWPSVWDGSLFFFYLSKIKKVTRSIPFVINLFILNYMTPNYKRFFTYRTVQINWFFILIISFSEMKIHRSDFVFLYYKWFVFSQLYNSEICFHSVSL